MYPVPFPHPSPLSQDGRHATAPLHPRLQRELDQLMCRRRARAMDIEFAVFERRYGSRFLVMQVGSDAVVAIDRSTKKTVARRIVRLDQ